ncbi:hypothetical protein AAG570_013473 [Ranatra chinensis]|uniref:Uncharacterized protein n=1 Tax=Ranatra chinensis TaxID=642074 RepID=A0ABD0Z0I3_9HEMI
MASKSRNMFYENKKQKTTEIVESVSLQELSQEKIDKLMSSGKLPVVVGGTNYYIESILWKILIEEPSGSEGLLFERDEDIISEDAVLGAALEPQKRVRLAAAHLTRLIRYSESVFVRLLAAYRQSEDILVTDPPERHRHLIETVSKFTRETNDKCEGKSWCWAEMKAAEKEMVGSLGRLAESLEFDCPEGSRLEELNPEAEVTPELREIACNAFGTLVSSAEDLTRCLQRCCPDRCLQVTQFKATLTKGDS